jgi:hypothetical protein
MIHARMMASGAAQVIGPPRTIGPHRTQITGDARLFRCGAYLRRDNDKLSQHDLAPLPRDLSSVFTV